MADSVAPSVVRDPSQVDLAMVRQMGNPSTHNISGEMPRARDLAVMPSGPDGAQNVAKPLGTIPEDLGQETRGILDGWGDIGGAKRSPPRSVMEVDSPGDEFPADENEQGGDEGGDGADDRFHEGSVYGEGAVMDPEQERHDKVSYLSDIDMLARELKIYNPPKRYTLDDDIDDIRFERDRLQLQVQATRGAQTFKGGIKFTAMFLEIMNDKMLRGAVPIKGLHKEICSDMRDGKYDSPLTRLYKKHFRRGTTSPEMELGMLMGNSVMRVVGKNLVGKQAFRNFVEDTVGENVLPASATNVRVASSADMPNAQTMDSPFEPAAPLAPEAGPGPGAQQSAGSQETQELKTKLSQLEALQMNERRQFQAQMMQMSRMAESLGERHREVSNELAKQRQKQEQAERRASAAMRELQQARSQSRKAAEVEAADESGSVASGQVTPHAEEDADEASVLNVFDDKGKGKGRRGSPPLKLNM